MADSRKSPAPWEGPCTPSIPYLNYYSHIINEEWIYNILSSKVRPSYPGDNAPYYRLHNEDETADGASGRRMMVRMRKTRRRNLLMKLRANIMARIRTQIAFVLSIGGRLITGDSCMPAQLVR
jgi:hypothetical protein